MNVDSSPLLKVSQLTKHFGGVHALNRVDFELFEGELLGCIGPNGSGKTTIVNLITGFVKPTGGNVYYGGKDITGLPPYKRVRLGIARTFQNIELFDHATVLQNLLVGRHRHRKTNMVQELLFFKKQKKKDMDL